MKAIRFRVASRKYRSKLDFKNAYEQIRLVLKSVAKSGLITPSGTFVSRVMQQGDTNAPDTMHRVCSLMFSQVLGRFLDVFYDDVFIYSHTLELMSATSTSSSKLSGTIASSFPVPKSTFSLLASKL
ncbi:hypothetical protein JCM11641_000991 [Rhodosporidiobolus odoratus]